jgi:phosphate transport system permease protein
MSNQFSQEKIIQLRKKRSAADRRFKTYGLIATLMGMAILFFLLFTIFSKGYSSFQKTVIELDVTFDQETLKITPNATYAEQVEAKFFKVKKNAIANALPDLSKKDIKLMKKMFSINVDKEIKEYFLQNPNILNTTQKLLVTAHSDVDQMLKGNAKRNIEEKKRKLNDRQLEFFDEFVFTGRLKSKFNNFFFTNADSRHPELAGIAGSFVGSLFTLITVFLLAFPIGIGASIYLEEFAPKNKFTELIEVNIANLAAVPSIVFGLLGLGILLNVFGFPRSTPLVGGTVLALMTLPTIIIACRASLKAVPPSIKEGALAMGASKMQAVFHHQVPLALPGTLTGTIIGLAQALGETAPLIMIGMIAFIPNIPTGFTEPSAALPVQIYLWVESAERGFQEKTAAAIMMILIFLFLMNAIAVFLRSRFERKW